MTITNLEKVLGLKPSAVVLENMEEDFSVYGSDRTKRTKTMLTLLLREDRELNIAYPQILFVDVQKQCILTIFTTFGVIKLHGKRLDLISKRIKHGSLSYIVEGGKENPPQTPDGVCVFEINIEIRGLFEE